MPCGPVYAIDEIFADSQYRARGNIETVEDARAGTLAIPAVVPRLTRTPGRIESLGTALGADLAQVFGRLLGLDDEAIADLKARGIV